jgi:hypothetical protein
MACREWVVLYKEMMQRLIGIEANPDKERGRSSQGME